MDPASIVIICGVATLLIERVFSRIQKSSCWRINIDLSQLNSEIK